MKQVLFAVLLLVTLPALSQVPAYGSNRSAGAFKQINGVRLYYEIYGSGEPLLLIHGNSTGIKGWEPQIAYFAQKYRVIAVDCRGRGQSELGKDSLTYLQQAADLDALLKALGLDSVTVIGKSDGGIISLLMGIYYPGRLKRIVAFGSNMRPDSTALYATEVQQIHDSRVEAEAMLAKGDETKNWRLEQQRYRLMEFQPHVTAEELARIPVPVLVMSCDRDLIREEHTLFIYKSIPNASLCILPGEVHKVPNLNPDLFNETVNRWLSRPFRENAVRFK